MKNKKNIYIGALLLVCGILIGWLIFGGNGNHVTHELPAPAADTAAATVWTCSMHPQIRQDKPGKCPICGMDLIPLNNGNDDNKDFDKIQMSGSAIKIAEVQTTIVQKSAPFKEIRLPGKVKADERKIAVITSHFAGRVEKLFVNFTGQEVQEGEKMATVYSPGLVTAQKELFEAARMKQNSPEYYKAAKSKLKLWSLTDEQIDNIETNGEIQYYFDVVANLGGTVIKREVALGDHIEEGAKLFEITDLSVVWILFDAYESDLPWIRTGDKVDFEVQSLPGKTYTGTVKFIDPVLDPETRVAYVRLEVNNPGKALKPEMFVRGTIKAELPADAFVIPKSAVLWTGKKAVVYVKVPEQSKPTFEYREITLGEDAGNFYVVKDGLREGEEIVSNGVFKVDAAAQLSGKKSMMNPEAGASGSENNNKEMKGPEGSHEHLHQISFSFKVYGNCEMCRERIEKAAKTVKGVLKANWNVETKMMEVTVLDNSIKAGKVSAAIAAAGHDTEFEKAPESAYEELPGCCRYDRESR